MYCPIDLSTNRQFLTLLDMHSIDGRWQERTVKRVEVTKMQWGSLDFGMTYGAEKKKLVHLDKDIAMIQFRDIRREIYDILCIYVARIYIYMYCIHILLLHYDLQNMFEGLHFFNWWMLHGHSSRARKKRCISLGLEAAMVVWWR